MDRAECAETVIELQRQENERLRTDLAAARQEAKDAEHQMWIKALLKVLPEEKAVLFREICLARAALKGDGDE